MTVVHILQMFELHYVVFVDPSPGLDENLDVCGILFSAYSPGLERFMFFCLLLQVEGEANPASPGNLVLSNLEVLVVFRDDGRCVRFI